MPLPKRNLVGVFYLSRVMRGKTGLLLIDTFERLFSQNECGLLEVGGRLLFVRDIENLRYQALYRLKINTVGYLG